MKKIEINVPITAQMNFFDLPIDSEIHNIRLTTNNCADLRNLGLILKIFHKERLIIKKLIQPTDRKFELFEIGLSKIILADRIEIESQKNIQFFVIGVINY